MTDTAMLKKQIGMQATRLGECIRACGGEGMNTDDVLKTSYNLMAVTLAQAEDEGLWFKARTAPEAYLQQELRALHEAVERHIYTIVRDLT